MENEAAETRPGLGLRILLILPEFPPAIGGMQTHAQYLSAHLHSRGYQIEVYTYQGATTFAQEEAGAFDAAAGYPIHRVMSRIGYWHSVDLLVDAVRRFRPHLVYSSTTFYGLLTDLTGVPVVCRSVGNDVMRPWIAYPYRPGSGLLGHWRLEKPLYDFFRQVETPELIEILFRDKRVELMASAARSASRILANSAFTKELLEEIGVQSRRVQIVVGGVDSSRFADGHKPPFDLRRRLGIPRDRVLLTTICRLVDKKAVDFLLTSFAGYAPRRRNWHLLVVGRGRRAKRLARMAEALGLNDRVTFAGPVPHKEIHHYFRITDVFVLASRVQHDPLTGLTDAETMGRVLCEANAASVPVVAARSGGIPSVIVDGRNGLLFEPDDELDLLARLEAVLGDSERTGEMVREGRRLAKTRFDWSVVLETHERVFRDVLGIEPTRRGIRPTAARMASAGVAG